MNVGTTALKQYLIRIFRPPSTFLKQGVADASLKAKGVFLPIPEVFSTPKSLH